MSSIQGARKAEKKRKKVHQKKLQQERTQKRLDELLQDADLDQMEADLARLEEIPFLDPAQKKKKAKLQADVSAVKEYLREKEEAEHADSEVSSDDSLDDDDAAKPLPHTSIATGSEWAAVFQSAPSVAAVPAAPPMAIPSSSASGRVPVAASAAAGGGGGGNPSSALPMAVRRRMALAGAKRTREGGDEAGTSGSDTLAQPQRPKPQDASASKQQVVHARKEEEDARDMEALLDALADDSD